MAWLNWIGVGSIFAALAVGLGAFGSHSLRNSASPRELEIFETAVRYHMYHAIALVTVGFLLSKIDAMTLRVSTYLFAVGILLFSGSLYAMVLTGHKWLGAVTPFGGVFFVVAWILVAVSVFTA